MHEEEYCNTHYTNSSWKKEREGQMGRGWRGRGEGWEEQRGGVNGAEGRVVSRSQTASPLHFIL